MTSHAMTRSQKIENLDLAINLIREPEHLALHNLNSFISTPQYTSLIGPNIAVKTPQYTGTITVEFDGSIVRYETYGYVHRFADTNAFLEFFKKTLLTPLHACYKMAGDIGGKTMGNSVILQKDNSSYYIREAVGGFEVSVNNQKIIMSYDDVVGFVVGS